MGSVVALFSGLLVLGGMVALCAAGIEVRKELQEHFAATMAPLEYQPFITRIEGKLSRFWLHFNRKLLCDVEAAKLTYKPYGYFTWGVFLIIAGFLLIHLAVSAGIELPVFDTEP